MNKEFVKDSLDEISTHEIDILSYLVNNFMTKKDLYYSKCNLIKENINYKQALNEIREYCNNPFNWRYTDHYIEKAAVLQIIDKVLGDEK